MSREDGAFHIDATAGVEPATPPGMSWSPGPPGPSRCLRRYPSRMLLARVRPRNCRVRPTVTADFMRFAPAVHPAGRTYTGGVKIPPILVYSVLRLLAFLVPLAIMWVFFPIMR